jgi:FliI/YscN family ATPase
VESAGPAAAIGDFCEIQCAGRRRIRTQVIGFRDGHVLSLPFEETSGLELGDLIVARKEDARVEVGPELLGRVLDGFGKAMDSGPPIEPERSYELYKPPPGPLEREHIVEPLVTGIRAIDSLLPCGKGQRIGIFGGSGVGKSTLLGSMCRHNFADVAVVVLVGERNREVRAFIDHDLGAEGMKRSVVVVATSDRPAPLRIRSVFVALAIAEYFRDQGADVLLVMDSVTRFAMAQREIGLASGEPPATKGYTPSVFAELPRLLERAGPGVQASGTITGLFTVLVDGDDHNEPVADAVRGILDGHIVLDRAIAERGRYPAVNVLRSLSRTMPACNAPNEQAVIDDARRTLAAYDNMADMIRLGAYRAGADPEVDRAIRLFPKLETFLRQGKDERGELHSVYEQLAGILNGRA